ncbi:MAG TPA: 1-acyl-sn-glycerol-3-phosphate acyltransferase, partial [Flavobacterium sp.]|nr:1-acyl-sn-glycerol-3-phosphate acyltransferase [Flavobacterium sp.]
DEKRADFIKSLSEKENEVIIIDRQQLNETFLGHLKDDFNRLINYSFVAVILILWYFFRRFELVLISLVPITITGFITMGIMGLFDIQLNIFSTIVTTLIFGHGIDFTIFMTSALQKEYTHGKSELTTYRTSILLAVLTTILAIGALVFAQHPALKSISTLSLIGVFSALIITFVFYPIVFKICIANRVKHHKSPITFRLFLHSFISFFYYGFGCIFLSVIGRLFVWIIPRNKENKMLKLRSFLSKFLTSVLYSNPFVKKEILNPHNEDFSKPAVIVSNHTSFLDSLTLSMVSPKIIFLVNDWVYNSPVFGRFVKMAGFYPVSEGVEGSVEHLREKVEQGYSLMVFPEGSRSEDNHIRRFHKGAFYLAEQFNLDILPVYIHGNSEVLPKNDYIIYDGSMTVKIGERIAQNHPDFGENYPERTKKINRFFRTEFTALRQQIEDENYFEKRLYLAYLYKDAEIIEAVKTDFTQHKSAYHALFLLIGNKANIYHIADNYGQIDMLLSWQYPLRKITTFIKDEEKRCVAAINYPVGKSNIFYTNEFNLSDIEIDTLLISTEMNQNLVIPETVQKVFLIGNVDLSVIKNHHEFTEFIHENGVRGFERI